ncbi:MAG: cytochrome C oxidase subunit IV family protein [Chromatiales bacterium]|nr:cytochrome C oxidase subunit IV family protein [Chromatiales bacterium]
MQKGDHELLLTSTITWLLLLALTLVTYAAAQLGVEGKWLILGVLAIALIKGKLIIDRFMGLRWVGSFWRPMLDLYLFTVGGLIATAFLLP